MPVVFTDTEMVLGQKLNNQNEMKNKSKKKGKKRFQI